MADKIEKSNSEEELKKLYNHFLPQYVSLIVDLHIYENMKPDETAYEKSLAQGQDGRQVPPNQVPRSMKIRVTAKEAVEETKESVENKKRILDSILAVKGSKALKDY